MSGRLYQVLGLKPDASEKDIQQAYRRLAKKYHPDSNRGDKNAEEQFKRISAAYQILKDPQTRARYDRGEIDGSGQERGFDYSNRQRNYHQHGFDHSSGFPGFEDILGDLFGQRTERANRSGFQGGNRYGRQPQSQTTNLKVSFLEAALGASKKVTLPDGTSVALMVPAGIETGKKMRLRSKNQPGSPGSSEVLVEIEVEAHERFDRDGLNILLDLPVPLETAILGGKAQVPTIHGEVQLNIPSWTTSGKTLRLRGKGIKTAEQVQPGDQLVRILIDLPTDPDPDLIDHFKAARAR